MNQFANLSNFEIITNCTGIMHRCTMTQVIGRIKIDTVLGGRLLNWAEMEASVLIVIQYHERVLVLS